MHCDRRFIKLPRWWYPPEVSVSTVLWFVYFAFLYFSLWIPSRFTFVWKETRLGPLMVPWFVWTWVLWNFLVIAGMFGLYRCLGRRGLLDEDDQGPGEVK